MKIIEKNQSFSRAAHRLLRKLQLEVLLMMACLYCTVSSAGTSRLYPPSTDETGAFRFEILDTSVEAKFSLKDMVYAVLTAL
jgi:hypothetical protein